jgi:hypothetical protein
MTISYIQQSLTNMIKFDVNGDTQSQSILKKDGSNWLNSDDEIVDLTGETVSWLDEAAYTAEQDAIAALQTFKSTRQSLLNNAVVTASTFEFDADEISIGRMASALIAVSDELDTYSLSWSLASTATGVMTTITKADLKLAHQLAVQNMANIWGV